MDLTVIANFKSYYLRRVMAKMLQTVNIHRTDDELDAITVVKSFWKKLTIMDAVSIVD